MLWLVQPNRATAGKPHFGNRTPSCFLNFGTLNIFLRKGSHLGPTEKSQREKANNPVVQVVQLKGPLERLSDCRTVPYRRFFLVRNEEAGGSNPLSSTIFSKRLRACQTVLPRHARTKFAIG